MLKGGKQLLVLGVPPNIAAEVQAYVPITITTRSLAVPITITTSWGPNSLKLHFFKRSKIKWNSDS